MVREHAVVTADDGWSSAWSAVLLVLLLAVLGVAIAGLVFSIKNYNKAECDDGGMIQPVLNAIDALKKDDAPSLPDVTRECRERNKMLKRCKNRAIENHRPDVNLTPQPIGFVSGDVTSVVPGAPIIPLQYQGLVAGDSNNPLALIVHGFPSSADEMRFAVQRMADAGYYAVAPYLRGYQPTSSVGDQVPPANITLAYITTDLIELSIQLGQSMLGQNVYIGTDWAQYLEKTSHLLSTRCSETTPSSRQLLPEETFSPTYSESWAIISRPLLLTTSGGSNSPRNMDLRSIMH